MSPGRVMKRFGGSGIRNFSGNRPRSRWDLVLGGTLCVLIAAWLLNSPLRALAQEKPLQIGVLALGPRSVPHWQCGDARQNPGERRRETMPFYILGLLDALEKINY